MYKKCVKTYKRDVTICPSCGSNDSLHDLNYDPYYCTVSKHPDVVPRVIIGEPCMVNLNSIAANWEVVEHVQKVTGLNNESNPQKWTFLHNDGILYVYAGNHQLWMLAVRIEIAPLFYLFLHLKYQQLHLRDLFERVQMPPELQQYQQENESFSTSNVSNHGQGADFIHEEINKLVKKFLPPKIPTQEIWEEFAEKQLI